MTDNASATWLVRSYRTASARLRAFAHHDDPLVEASNWVALLVGTHLPFWPLYVWWSAGAQAWPTSLLTMGLTPVFLVIPILSRRSGLLARIATPLTGIVNTVFTVWILGTNSGTALFLAPCAALAAFSFRRDERWVMLGLTALPLVVYYGLQHAAPAPLHRYDPESARSLVTLNVISIAAVAAAFGWLQADIYQRMEQRTADPANPGDRSRVRATEGHDTRERAGEMRAGADQG